MNHIVNVSSWPGKPTESCPGSPSTPTSESLTDDHIEASWISSLAGTRAPDTATRARGMGTTMLVQGCGLISFAWSARFDPDSYSWRTAQGLPLPASTGLSQIFSRSGIAAYGRYWALDTSALHTTGTGSGSWPTPTTQGNEFCPSMAKWPKHARLQRETFPTCTASEAGRGKAARGKNAQGGPSQGEYLGGKPNPEWREWLMGWPIKWSALGPLATDRSQTFTRWLSAFSTSD